MTVNNLGVASAEDNGDRCEGSGICTQSEYAEAELPPAGINIGGAYTLRPRNDVTLTLLSSAHLLPDQPKNFGGGVEIGIRDQFFLRGGLKDNRLYTNRFWDNEDYWYAGAGINVPLDSSTIRLDYAYSPAADFDGVHAFSAGVTF